MIDNHLHRMDVFGGILPLPFAVRDIVPAPNNFSGATVSITGGVPPEHRLPAHRASRAGPPLVAHPRRRDECDERSCAEPGCSPIPRSSSACPAAIRCAAAAFNTATPVSSWAEPTCSIDREPRRDDHTICTATAPDPVFTVRPYATTTPYGRRLSAQIHSNSPPDPQVKSLQPG